MVYYTNGTQAQSDLFSPTLLKNEAFPPYTSINHSNKNSVFQVLILELQDLKKKKQLLLFQSFMRSLHSAVLVGRAWRRYSSFKSESFWHFSNKFLLLETRLEYF